ncbi:MAG TPA: DedA family protein [Candidatus Saccharimonadales bacterium]|nr:DedA family protein [Candidatus Saccharimonadales bacterium]
MTHALPPDTPSFITALAPTIDHYGYVAVGGLIMLEDFGVPAPGETILIAAAVFAGIGELNIFLVILVALAGAIIGDNIGFAIGDFGGRPLVERFGKYVFLTKKRLDEAEAFFNRNGGRVVVVARFIEGLRQLNGIIAGISEMKWLRFIMFNTIGAGLWVGLWSMVGYFGGSHIDTFVKYGLYFTIAAGTAIVGYIIYRIIKHKRQNSTPSQ